MGRGLRLSLGGGGEWLGSVRPFGECMQARAAGCPGETKCGIGGVIRDAPSPPTGTRVDDQTGAGGYQQQQPQYGAVQPTAQAGQASYGQQAGGYGSSYQQQAQVHTGWWLPRRLWG